MTKRSATQVISVIAALLFTAGCGSSDELGRVGDHSITRQEYLAVFNGLPAEEQVEDVLKQIQVVIPIRMESLKMAVKVPAKYAAKAYNVVAQIAQIKESEWQNDGSWIGVVSLPAGLQMELLDGLNSLTHGRVQTKLLQN